MNAAGAISSRFAPNWRNSEKIATVITWVSRPKVSATRKSFHVHRNWKIASDAIAGRPSGRISRRKIVSSEAPSMRADSRMSFGMPDEEVAQQEDRERQPERAVEEDQRERRVEDPEVVVEREHRDQRHLQRHHEQRDRRPGRASRGPGTRSTRTRSRRARRRRSGSPCRRSRRSSVVPSARVIVSLSSTFAVVLERGLARLGEHLPPARRADRVRGQQRVEEQPERRHQPQHADEQRAAG